MIKEIGGNKVDISSQEYEYYKFLSSQYPVDDFNNLFNTDENGIITRIAPAKSTAWVIMWFIQNLMINQHLDAINKRIGKLEQKIGELNEQK